MGSPKKPKSPAPPPSPVRETASDLAFAGQQAKRRPRTTSFAGTVVAGDQRRSLLG